MRRSSTATSVTVRTFALAQARPLMSLAVRPLEPRPTSSASVHPPVMTFS